MKPLVSIIMGSTSDLPVMEKAAQLLDDHLHSIETTHWTTAHSVTGKSPTYIS